MVVEVYQKMVRYFADNDPTTRILVEELLRKEEEHASDLSDMLYITNPETGKSEGEDPGANPLGKETAEEIEIETEGKQDKKKRPAA
jgi:bacterioferritin